MSGPGSTTATVFFDIGDTLASAHVDPAGTGIELVVLPRVADVLEALREAGVRIGVISDPGPIPTGTVDAALERAGLREYLDPSLIRYGRKDEVAVFEQAAQIARATGTAGRLVFVGEDATERWFARAADFVVCPHPILALRAVLGRSPLRYLRVRVPAAVGDGWRGLLRSRPVVPLHVGVGPDGVTELYAVADTATALELDDLGLWVDRLGGDDEPLTGELHRLRDDGRDDAPPGTPAGSAAAAFDSDRAARRVLASGPEGLLVAVPAGRSVEALHLGRPRHGHVLKLAAVPSVLDRDPDDGRGLDGTASSPATPTLDPGELKIIEREVVAERLALDVGRLCGAAPLADGGVLRSRHVRHPDNARAVAALAAELASRCGDRLHRRLHRFGHQGRTLDNLEAVLPARGLPGAVLVCAHLDSTAARAPGYRADIDPAPGADDDGSGVAGVLAAAQTVLALDDELAIPRREVRFVLFNAEEQGLVGSRAYARDQAANGSDIRAVLQLDMIGFDGAAARTFELHAGFAPAPAVQTRSLALAETVAALVPAVSPALPPPQIYPASPDGSDPAEQRSDHHSFALHGYPAVLASEDFFVGPVPSSPVADPNPNYHSPDDTVVDVGYVGDIVRVVTAAAWLCATR